MRINQFVAQSSGLSRRKADKVILEGRVLINNQAATLGHAVKPGDKITLDNQPLNSPEHLTTIMLNKPVGYISSRQGQGNKTIYRLLPKEFHNLKPVGRLDKDSSGLLLLTDDGELANRLIHPRYGKEKIYQVVLNKPLELSDQKKFEKGVLLGDGVSVLKLKGNGNKWVVIMYEGRNRQIRRTFAKLSYQVIKLHRLEFGSYKLPKDIKPGEFKLV